MVEFTQLNTLLFLLKLDVGGHAEFAVCVSNVARNDDTLGYLPLHRPQNLPPDFRPCGQVVITRLIARLATS